MLKRYKIGRYTYQYEEGTQPDGAVEVVRQETIVKAVAPENKAKTPANKARKAVTK